MSIYTDPDYSTAAIITIDVQHDTLDGQPFEIPGTSAILPQIQAILTNARVFNFPIIHVVRIYKSDGSNVDLCRRDLIEKNASLVLENTHGCEIADELLPNKTIKLDTSLLLAGEIQIITPSEVIIYKSRWGAFYQTPLDNYLKHLNISTLIFTGCNFPNCPRASIYEASERDYKIVLVQDAISGLYNQGLKEMNNIGVTVLSSQEIISILQNQNILQQTAG